MFTQLSTVFHSFPAKTNLFISFCVKIGFSLKLFCLKMYHSLFLGGFLIKNVQFEYLGR